MDAGVGTRNYTPTRSVSALNLGNNFLALEQHLKTLTVVKEIVYTLFFTATDLVGKLF